MRHKEINNENFEGMGFRVAAVDFNGVQELETWPDIGYVTEEYFHKVFPEIEQGCECLKGF